MKNQCFPKICEKALILSPCWEAKNLDFRISVDVFSMPLLNNILEATKIEKNCTQEEHTDDFGLALRNARLAGERKREGSEAS